MELLNELVITFCIVFTSVSLGFKIADYLFKIIEEKNGKNN